MSSFIAWIIAASLVVSGNKAQVSPEFAAAVAQEVTNKPLSSDVRMDAIVFVEMAWRESAYKEDAVGDHGVAQCALQVHVMGKSVDGWTPKEVREDMYKCVHTAMYIMQYSFRTCHKHPLAAYASGSCNRGTKLADFRMWEAKTAYKKMSPIYIEVNGEN